MDKDHLLRALEFQNIKIDNYVYIIKKTYIYGGSLHNMFTIQTYYN